MTAQAIPIENNNYYVFFLHLVVLESSVKQSD